MDTRDRILDATTGLLQRNGFTGTGLKQIGALAAAPSGSIYHFFPGGKEELGGEVIRRAGAGYLALVMAVLRSTPDPVAAVEAVFAGAADVLASTDYRDACPVATVALEVASSNETLRLVTAGVFDEWAAVVSEFLVDAGVAPSRSGNLALVLIELLEGGFLLSRAAKRTTALAAAGEAASVLVALALEAGAGPGAKDAAVVGAPR